MASASDASADAQARPRRVSAYLKIADGCNARCSFCIIPRIKGRLHSLPPEAVLDDAKRLATEGARELGARRAGHHLLRPRSRDGGRSGSVCWSVWPAACPMSPGSASCTPTRAVSQSRFCATMADLPQVCKYLDIPLQHSSPAVLQRMRRPHDASQTRRMLDAPARSDARDRAPHNLPRRLSRRDRARFPGPAGVRPRDQVRPRRRVHVLASALHAGRAHARTGAGARQTPSLSRAHARRARDLAGAEPRVARQRDDGPGGVGAATEGN